MCRDTSPLAWKAYMAGAWGPLGPNRRKARHPSQSMKMPATTTAARTRVRRNQLRMRLTSS